MPNVYTLRPGRLPNGRRHWVLNDTLVLEGAGDHVESIRAALETAQRTFHMFKDGDMIVVPACKVNAYLEDPPQFGVVEIGPVTFVVKGDSVHGL